MSDSFSGIVTGTPPVDPPDESGGREASGVRRYIAISWAAGAIALLLSLSVLLGWIMDSPVLTRVLLARTPMRPWSAVGLALGGAGLLLLLHRPEVRWRVLAARACALLLALIGAVMLLKYMLELGTGLDWLLFPRRIEELPYVHPGRPSEIGSASMILCSVGLLSLSIPGRWGVWVSQLSGLALVLIGLPILVGSLYGVGAFYAVANLAETALNTAFILVALGLGLVFARPGEGPLALFVADNLGGRVFRRLAPVVILLPLLLVLLQLVAVNMGLVTVEFSAAAFVIVLMLLLVAIIWWTARRIYLLDAERQMSLQQERSSRRAEKATRRQIQALLDSTTIGVYGLDREGRCTLINSAGAHMLGYERSDLVGRAMHSLMHHSHPDGSPFPEEDCAIHRSLEREDTLGTEDEVFWRRDGSALPVEYSATPLSGDEGVAGTVVTFVDITERKRAREELRLLSETGVELGATLDPDELLRRMARLVVPRIADYCVVHLADAEMGRQPRSEVASADPEREDLLREAVERLTSLGDPVCLLANEMRREGASVFSGCSFHMEQGVKELDSVGVVRKLDARCAATATLRVRGRIIGSMALISVEGSGKQLGSADVNLVRQLADRAAMAIENSRLYADSERGREELRRSMEIRRRLMRGFTHDVRNPLGAADMAMQFLEMGGEGPLSDAQLERLGRVRSSVAQALSLIGDLTELARADTGQIQVDRKPVDLVKLTLEITDEYRAHAEAKGLKFETTSSPATLPPVESDPSRVRQILGNLLSNAVKYTERGCVCIRVRDVPGEREQIGDGGRPQWVALEVQDTGPGIPEDEQETIFEEFSRLSSGTTSGAGIGLAISRKVAQLIGGEITVSSDGKTGSTFTLWLPKVVRREQTARSEDGRRPEPR